MCLRLSQKAIFPLSMPDNTPLDKLPEVALADLPKATTDYLIAQHSATGRPIADLIRELLNRASGYVEGGGK